MSILYLISHSKYLFFVFFSILWGIDQASNSQCLKILNNFFNDICYHVVVSNRIIRLIQDLRAVAKVHRSHMIEILVPSP